MNMVYIGKKLYADVVLSSGTNMFPEVCENMTTASATSGTKIRTVTPQSQQSAIH